jgi:hypothetical protein
LEPAIKRKVPSQQTFGGQLLAQTDTNITGFFGLRENRFYHVAMDIGKSVIAALESIG